MPTIYSEGYLAIWEMWDYTVSGQKDGEQACAIRAKEVDTVNSRVT